LGAGLEAAPVEDVRTSEILEGDAPGVHEAADGHSAKIAQAERTWSWYTNGTEAINDARSWKAKTPRNQIATVWR
jgi:hypothetical protein